MTYVAFLLLAGLYLWTTWDGYRVQGWRQLNPLVWGGASVVEGTGQILDGSGPGAFAQLLTFYRREPWVKWLMIDHLGLKLLVSFFLCWDAWAVGRRAWPYVTALYIIGSLAPLLYLLSRGRAREEAWSSAQDRFAADRWSGEGGERYDRDRSARRRPARVTG
jgi:hypothetical protein